MRYLKQGITDLLYSSVAEVWAPYDSETTYQTEEGTLTDTSVVRVGNYYYRTLIDDNLDNDPEDTLGVKWIRWQVSNKHAMIDLRSTTVTVSEDEELVVEASLDLDDMLALGYYTASTVTVDNLDDTAGIISGFTIADSADLDSTVIAGVAYLGDPTTERIITEDEPKTFTASKDTYVDISTTGLVYTETTLGAGDPGVAGTDKRIAKVVTDGTEITSVDDQRALVDNVVYTQSDTQSFNEFVEDYYTYIYEEYSLEFNRARVFDIPKIGSRLRITFSVDVNIPDSSCGFMVLGESQDMGDTLYGVDFSFASYSVKETDDFGLISITKRGIQDLVDFETIIPSTTVARKKREIKTIYDDIVAFILDPEEDSVYENLITLGTIENVSTVLANPVQTTIAWSIQEVI